MEKAKKQKEKILVCVAWPYANGYLHLGHLAGSLLAPDIFARYHRAIGNNVLMVSGSDEHGTPIAVRAEAEGSSPEEIVEFYRKQTLRDLESLGISFDLFFRTSHPNHKKIVKEIFLDLLKKGYIYKKKTVEAFCPHCSKFLADRFIEGSCPYCESPNARGDQCDQCGKPLDFSELLEPKCKICGVTPSGKETEHYFFKLSGFEDRLRDFILKAKEHMKKNVVLFTLQWLERGLKDRPITRDISWGIEIPEIEESELRLKGAEKKRIYVWFEAVIGYLSASIEWARLKGEPEKWKDFWLNPEAKPYYFLGKDNIPFHSIIFPAILIGYGEGREAFTLPYNIPANEYLQLEGRQFSKSRGHLITVKDFLKIYPVDALRYYLTVMMPENRDASFVLDEFIKSVNSELVGNLGNFIHRALSFSYKHFGEVPSPGALEEIDRKALKDMEEHTKRVFKYIERCEFKKGLKEVFALSQKANVYFDRKAPWSEVKKGKEKAATTLYISLQFVKVLSHLIYPFIPKGAERVWHYLNMPLNESNVDLRCTLAPLDTGTQLKKPSPVFKKLEKKEESLTNGGLRFEELELRIGTVVSVSEHPQAEKLYLLKVNLGKETRQLVAGIKPFYRKEELQKKKIVVLCNLKPRKIRGEVSNGMLLAAEKEKVVSLLSVSPEVEDGTSVKLVESYTGKEISFEGRKKNIDIKDFGKFVIKIGSLKEENGEAVVKLKNEVFSLDSHLYKLPSQKRCVVVLSPVKGVLAAGGELVTTDREEIKEGAHIR